MSIGIVALITIVASLGAAWGGAKVGQNGTKERVENLYRLFGEHDQKDNSNMLNVAGRLGSVEDTKETFLCNGTQTVFSFGFAVNTANELLVLLTSLSGVETIMQLDIDYTVVLNTNQSTSPGGTVTFTEAPEAGVPLLVMRNMDFVRTAQFTSSVPPGVIEGELDRLTMYAQQLREKQNRSLHVSAATQTSRPVQGRSSGSTTRGRQRCTL